MDKKVVLAVDDSKTVLTSINAMLKEVYEVRTAMDAKAAESLLAGGLKPNLMLLDIEMPGASGIQLLKKLKANKKNRFPIIFLSSKSSEVNVTKVSAMGADGFIEKPFDKEKLMKKLEAWLR